MLAELPPWGERVSITVTLDHAVPIAHIEAFLVALNDLMRSAKRA